MKPAPRSLFREPAKNRLTSMPASTASSPSLKKARRLTWRRASRPQYTGDFVVDEKRRNITVTDEGWEKVDSF